MASLLSHGYGMVLQKKLVTQSAIAPQTRGSEDDKDYRTLYSTPEVEDAGWYEAHASLEAGWAGQETWHQGADYEWDASAYDPDTGWWDPAVWDQWKAWKAQRRKKWRAQASEERTYELQQSEWPQLNCQATWLSAVLMKRLRLCPLVAQNLHVLCGGMAPEPSRQMFINADTWDSPTTIIAELAKKLGKPAHTFTGGKWQDVTTTKGSTLQSHIRVPAAIANLATQHGFRGVFTMIPSKSSSPSGVAWVKRHEDSFEEYFRTVLAVAEDQGKPLAIRTVSGAILMWIAALRTPAAPATVDIELLPRDSRHPRLTSRSVVFKLKDGPLLTSTLLLGFLDSGSNWDKPDALTNSEWRDLLRKQWSGINVDALDRAVAQQQVDVEKEWKLFLACLDELTRKAFTHLASHHHDEHVRKEAAHKARASGMCGLEPCHKSRHPKRCGDLSGKGAMGVTKLRKRVARLYELKCCLMLRLQDDNPRKDQQTHTCHNLINRLALREHGWSVRNVCQALEVAKRDLSELEQKTRKARIDQWKRDFVSDLKFAGRWLRGRKGMPSPQIKPTNGPVACGNDEAVEAIRDYWTHFWRKVEETSPDPDTIAARLIANSASVSTVAWTIPSAQQFHKQASSMRGAAGGDGWAAEDTRHLPLPVWNWYRALVERWLESGELPRPLTHARCVFLSKNHKIVNGTLKPDDARPITVLSIWWRVLMSTWLRRDECRAWTAQVIHPDVAYGCGSDAQVLAAKVLDSYSEAGFLGSLDYTKCFDCLRPDATAQLLQHTGFHHGLAAPAGRMWTNHKRWLSYQGHVAAQPMSCPLAVSQGDHAGPLAAALWLSAGCRWVTSNSPSWVARNGRTSVFMDDRSFTASSVDSLKIKIQSWETWSTRVGLLESMSKAQVAAKSLRQKASIACNFDPSLIRPDVLFLGVASRSRPRTDHEKETQRLAMETERLAVLGSFKLGYDCFARYARMFATSAACYGWLARMPTLTASSKLWATIKIGQGRVRMANKWMRALILGGNSHLDIIAASNLFRAVWKLRVQGSQALDLDQGLQSRVLASVGSHLGVQVEPRPLRQLSLCLGYAALLRQLSPGLGSAVPWWCWTCGS
ncbi:hypothetical protein AK812_SmicGene23344 [Symbiodinium microadriaticum]|uniref:Reverse transcriptase domain-containing protein n=1 Tax=Symbiodinium microadriaticum TaxID=2951 RepID=A0A1Q9DHR3_SYMMI|nr:hypothetical protein AK812_SmicGene23344 [Symbiodinium microadriaticum]